MYERINGLGGLFLSSYLFSTRPLQELFTTEYAVTLEEIKHFKWGTTEFVGSLTTK